MEFICKVKAKKNVDDDLILKMMITAARAAIASKDGNLSMTQQKFIATVFPHVINVEKLPDLAVVFDEISKPATKKDYTWMEMLGEGEEAFYLFEYVSGFALCDGMPSDDTIKALDMCFGASLYYMMERL